MSSLPCPFCAIAAGEIPASIVFSTDEIIAFRDNDPAAPTHILIIPRAHYASDALMTRTAPELWPKMLEVATRVSQIEGLDEGGYRLVINSGPDAGQSVDHLHLHILGGRPLSWPPG